MHLSGSLPEGERPVSVSYILIVRSSLLVDSVRLSGSLPEGVRPVTVSSVLHHVREEPPRGLCALRVACRR